MKRYSRLLAVGLLLALIWAAAEFSGLKEHLNAQVLRDAFNHNRLTGVLIFTVMFAVGNLAHIPGTIFLVAAVVALGPVWGGMATYAGACTSCVVTFLVIRPVGANAIRQFRNQIFTRVLARMDAHPMRSVLLLRLLFQTLPTLSYALALSGVHFRDYLLGTLLGLPLPILIYSVFFETLARWLHWSVSLHGA